jgi:hypothetical protein
MKLEENKYIKINNNKIQEERIDEILKRVMKKLSKIKKEK